MKKWVCFIFSFLFIFLYFEPVPYVFANQTYYARIKYDGTALYKTANASFDTSNVLFLVPRTYFVEIISKENEDFYQARYLENTGYVKKNDIQFVSGSPQKPFADKISFRVYAQNGLNLRTTPFESEGITNKITTIPFLETNLQFIGKITGEEAISNRGDVWYYCNYFRFNETLTGYVYAGYCDMLTSINDNTEILTEIKEPSFEELSAEKGTTSDIIQPLGSLSKRAQIIIIVAVCVPALLILYLLVKPTRIIASNKTSTKKSPETKKKKKRYRDDYYEIEN